ncbi:hypothetical protein AwWohl_10590 [Gammaproteobacteria bacterium]|nr:hypothetical protein AwWohl_10590 [Gammaproteobacteria bacterium]
MKILKILKVLMICGIGCVSPLTFAKTTLNLSEYSVQYTLDLVLESCTDLKQDSDLCSSNGHITYQAKDKLAPPKIIKLDNIDVNMESLVYNPLLNLKIREESAAGFTLVLDDFNFDGLEDIAIRSGNMGGYGGASYTVYLFDPTTNDFLLNSSLSELTEDSSGLFQVINKQLISYSKSGCCDHQTQKFNVINNQAVLVEDIGEAVDENNILTITTRKLIGTKWQETIQSKPYVEE